MKRRVSLLSVLLALRLLTRSYLDLLARTIDELGVPLVDALLAAVLGVEFLFHPDGVVIEGVQTAVLCALYLLATYSIIDTIFPTLALTRFENPKNRTRLELLTGLHVVAFFQIIAAATTVLAPSADTSINALTTGLLVTWAYLLTVVPVGNAYLLSRPVGGLREPPRQEQTLFQGFLYGSWESFEETYENQSWVWYWMTVAYLYAIPAFFLAIIFYVLGQFYPLFELAILVGIVAPYVIPGNRYDTIIERLDVEARLAAAVRFSLVNLKGAVTAATIVTGIILCGHAAVTSYPLLAVELPVSGATGLVSTVGLYVAILQYPVLGLLFWARTADRLPWVIHAWTRRAATFTGELPELPQRPNPDRFPVSLALPTVLFLLARWTIFRGYETAAPYRTWMFVWPVLVGLLAWRLTSESSPFPEVSEQWYVFGNVQLQFFGFFSILGHALPVVESGARRVPVSVGDPMQMFVFGLFLTSVIYVLPDLLNYVRGQLGTTGGSEQAADISGSEYRAIYALFFCVMGASYLLVAYRYSWPLRSFDIYLFATMLFVVVAVGVVEDDELTADGETDQGRGVPSGVFFTTWGVGLVVVGYVTVSESLGLLHGLLATSASLLLMYALVVHDTT